MINSYYILTNDKQEGPYTHQELMDMDLDGGAMVFSPLANDWQQASDLPEFAAYFESKGVLFPTKANLANFWWRLLAYIIDYILLIMFMVCVFGVLATIANFVHVTGGNADDSQQGDAGLKLIYVILFILYNSIFEATEMRGSIGKKICRLAVVNARGEGISFQKALSRNAAKLISSLVCGIGFLNVFWDSHKQAWHDHLAKTYVVKIPR